MGCPFTRQRTPDNLAARAGTARGHAKVSVQTKWMAAFGLMDAQVVELAEALVAAGELVVGCAALA